MLVGTFNFVSTANDAKAATDSIQNNHTFLSQLGIGEKVDLSDYNKRLTRAEFTALALEITNTSFTAEIDDSFADVGSDHEYATEIYTAKKLGIISGVSVDSFAPNKKITYGAAVKILSSLLGYEQYALVNGGYPMGYYDAARRIGLLSSTEIGMEDVLTTDVAIELLYNALHADLFEVSGIYNGDIKYDSKNEKNLLTKNFGLSSIEGVIQTSGLFSMVPNYIGTASIIDINGTELKCNIDEAEDFLGLRARVWYSDNKDAVAIDVDADNNVLEIDSEDIVAFNNYTLTVFEGVKQKNYKFDRGYSFVKNGRQFRNNANDFKLPAGKLVIIDNNCDGMYDIAHSFKKEYFIVSSIINTSNTIYDKNLTNKSFTFDNDGNLCSKLYIKDSKTGTVSKADFDDISVGMVLEVYESHDKILTQAVASSDTLKGFVTEVVDDKIVIDGTPYKKNSYFKANDTATIPGISAEFYVAPDGTITLMKSQTRIDSEYGYFLDYSDAKNGVESNTQIKLLTTKGIVERFHLNEYITLDGRKKVASDSNEIKNLLMYGGVPQYQPIRYALNDRGEVILIDCAADVWREPEMEDRYDRTYTGDNSMRKHLNRQSVYYTGNMGAPYYIYSSTTAIFSVPEALKNIGVNDKNTVKYDDNMFTLLTMSDLESYSKIVDAYDYNENFYPAVVVMYEKTTASQGGVYTTAQPPSTSASSYIVEKVTEAMSVSGDVSKRVYMLGMDGYKSYVISSNYYEDMKALDRIPNSGDIVRFSIDKDNEIMYIARDAKFIKSNQPISEVNTKKYGVTVSYGKDGLNRTMESVFSFVSGTVQIKNNNTYVLKTDQHPGGSVIVDQANNYFSLYRFGGTNNIIVYDVNTGKAYRGTKDDILDAIAAGDNASYVCARASYLTSTTIFVYNDETGVNS